MSVLIEVILPVFLIIGVGYLAVWRGVLSDAGVDGIMKFAQSIAIPMMLFLALARLDLAHLFDWRVLVSFYTGAATGFFLGLFGARVLFGRDWEDAVAIGFVGLFSNSVLLGMAVSERAYGVDALVWNFGIVSIHAPFCYALGIIAMESVRARGQGARQAVTRVARALIGNALVIGIGLGALVNLLGIGLPGAITDALELIARAGLPAALFGLGGVLYRYRPEGDLRLIAFLCVLSLGVHPVMTWGLGMLFELDQGPFRAAVLTAAMAPGINAYLFANMYGRATRIAASTVLIATGLCVLTAWGWMVALG